MKKILILAFLLMGETVFSQGYITKQAALEDIDHYNAILQEVHYNPFLFIPQEKYFRTVDSLKNQLPDSLSLKQFILVMHSITSLVEDSHSMPGIQQMIFSNEMKEDVYFPFHLRIEEDRFYAPHSIATESGVVPGSEILSINGRETSTLIKEFKSYIGGLPAYKEEMAGRLLSHFLFLHEVKPPFEIQYKTSSGEIGTATAEKGLTFMESIILNMPGLVQPNSYEIVDGKLGYINFGNMYENWEDFAVVLDSAFAHFSRDGIQHLAVDLRENSGGNSILGDLLFSYITDNKYQLQGSRKWKVSQLFKDKIMNGGNQQDEYLSLANGSVWEKGVCEASESPFRAEHKFRGEVYFLTGPFTFSSGNMVADGAKEYKIGKLVGEPTGENTNDFGEVLTLILPNSQININVTTSFDIGAACNPEVISPVVPDVVVPSHVDDLVSGRDRALEYVLNEIKK